MSNDKPIITPWGGIVAIITMFALFMGFLQALGFETVPFDAISISKMKIDINKDFGDVISANLLVSPRGGATKITGTISKGEEIEGADIEGTKTDEEVEITFENLEQFAIYNLKEADNKNNLWKANVEHIAIPLIGENIDEAKNKCQKLQKFSGRVPVFLRLGSLPGADAKCVYFTPVALVSETTTNSRFSFDMNMKIGGKPLETLNINNIADAEGGEEYVIRNLDEKIIGQVTWYGDLVSGDKPRDLGFVIYSFKFGRWLDAEETSYIRYVSAYDSLVGNLKGLLRATSSEERILDYVSDYNNILDSIIITEIDDLKGKTVSTQSVTRNGVIMMPLYNVWMSHSLGLIIDMDEIAIYIPSEGEPKITNVTGICDEGDDLTDSIIVTVENVGEQDAPNFEVRAKCNGATSVVRNTGYIGKDKSVDVEIPVSGDPSTDYSCGIVVNPTGKYPDVWKGDSVGCRFGSGFEGDDDVVIVDTSRSRLMIEDKRFVMIGEVVDGQEWAGEIKGRGISVDRDWETSIVNTILEYIDGKRRNEDIMEKGIITSTFISSTNAGDKDVINFGSVYSFNVASDKTFDVYKDGIKIESGKISYKLPTPKIVYGFYIIVILMIGLVVALGVSALNSGKQKPKPKPKRR